MDPVDESRLCFVRSVWTQRLVVGQILHSERQVKPTNMQRVWVEVLKGDKDTETGLCGWAFLRDVELVS